MKFIATFLLIVIVIVELVFDFASLYSPKGMSAEDRARVVRPSRLFGSATDYGFTMLVRHKI